MSTIEITEKDKVTEDKFLTQVANLLDEPNRPLLARLFAVLGPERLATFVHEALAIEKNGGMLTSNGDRRRSPGGVLVRLVKDGATAEEKRACFRRGGWAL